jgi:hypothetical protein
MEMNGFIMNFSVFEDVKKRRSGTLRDYQSHATPDSFSIKRQK